jgi:WD40 repeat protein
VLEGHLQYVCAVDWHPETNRIISSSHDRNILVWSFQPSIKGNWQSELVVFKTKVSILDVKWSHLGDKFCTSTGNKLASTGYYSDESKWWTCISMKEHKSSVVCVQFDRSGFFLASGSTDLRVYITSSYIDPVDAQNNFNENELPFPKSKFGEVLHKVALGAWVNNVAWGKDNKTLFILSHDSIMTIVSCPEKTTITVNLKHSPGTFIIPIMDESIYLVSFDRHIYQYVKQDDSWIKKKSLTKDESLLEAKPATQDPTSGGVADKIKMMQVFQKKQSLVITSTAQKNTHMANINYAENFGDFIVTADYAGFVKIWNI